MTNLFDEALGLGRDLAQVLVLDRLSAKNRMLSKTAGASVRTMRFHSRSKIRPLPWAEMFQKLGLLPVDQVHIPGPASDLGDVGNIDYYYALGALVQALKPESIFEFGTYLGVGTLAMAQNAPAACKIYTMDLPDAADATLVPGLDNMDQTHIVKSRHRVGEAFLRTPFKDHVTQIRDDSITFRAEKVVKNIDLVYVDGGHSTECVTKDTENAFRILSANGTVMWDDYFHAYPDVVNYLNHLADKFPLHSVPGSNVVIYSRRWDPAKKTL